MSIVPVSPYNHRIQRDGIAFYDWPFQNELMETRVHNISCSVLKDFTVVLIECKVWSRRMHVQRHAKVYILMIGSSMQGYLSLVMRKPFFCICENKDADQLRGDREADQRLCFRYLDSAIPLLPKYKISSL